MFFAGLTVMAESSKKVIGGFRILQEIQAGSGAQGTVYKAVCEDESKGITAKGTVVALKVMAVQDEDKSQWRKLEKRTRELSGLKHPNVVRYYGCFSEPGLFNDVHVVVQEFLQGVTLKDKLVHYPSGLDVDEALRIADASLAALIYTAGRGIVHRDIKPGNIFLCDNGDVKLIDFEIAKQVGGTTTSSASNIRGSFDYMAPDFTDAEFHGDVKSDVFSMGVVLHELLSGKTPYQRLEGDDKQANFAFLSRWAHALKDGSSPIHVSSRIKRLLAHTEDVFAKSLAPRREDRYPSFEAFREGLKAIRFRNLRNGLTTYQMLQFIGKGGFGEVFKARIRQTGQLVAIKHLLKSNYAERFYREAKIMKKLRDPAFVQFVDFFLMDIGTSQEAFLAMAFLDGMPGSSLRDAIKASGETPLEPRDVFIAFERYARGLRVMHTSGIFHRDIKPSNLYYPAGHPERAAIMDLGIARDINGTATSGQVPGTLDYMPPEVVVSDSRGDGGMDVYALGLCLYEALTGSMGYPRLPSGSAAMSAFFERAKSKIPPVFDSPKLAGDGEVLGLLAEMTNPDASKRIKNVAIVESRLQKIISERYGKVSLPPEPEPAAAEDFEDGAEAPTVALEPETRGTVATQAGGAVDVKAIEREKAIYRRRRSAIRRRMVRFVTFLVLAVVAIGGIGAGAYFSRDSITRWYAEFTLEKVVSEYQSGNVPTAQIKEQAWMMQWSPDTSGWLKLDDMVFDGFTNRLAVVKSMIREKHKKQEEEAKRKAAAAEEAEKRRQEAERRKAEEAARLKAEKERLAAEAARLKAEEEKRKADEETRLAAEAEAKRKAEEEAKRRAEEEAKRKAEEEARRKAEEVKRKAEEAERKRKAEEERQAKLAALRKETLEKCRELMAEEPIETRQNRLVKARKLLAKAVSTEGVFTDDSAKAISDEIGERVGWAVGRVHNRCGRDIVVGGRKVGAGKTELLVFKEGLPVAWICRADGYEPKDLPREFDGREIFVSEGDLVPLDVKVSLPHLEDGVTCFYNDKRVNGSISLKPGSYSFVYKWRGYRDQAVRIDVPLGVDCTLPAPREWTSEPVKVFFSSPDSGVVCKVDGRVVDSDVTLSPGEHLCEYTRDDYETQEIRFTVEPDKEAKLPPPGEWIAGKALASLVEAEAAAKSSDWIAAEAALRRADVRSADAQKRKEDLAGRISKRANLAKLLDNAQLYFDGGLANDALKCYYDICTSGFSLSEQDAAQAKEAYDMAMSRNKALIAECNRMLQQGRTLTRSMEDLENERKQLIDWYRAIRSNAATNQR